MIHISKDQKQNYLKVEECSLRMMMNFIIMIYLKG